MRGRTSTSVHVTKPPIHFMRVTFSSAATHVPTDYSALFDKERPMPVDVSLDSIRYRVGETMGVGYDDGASEKEHLAKSKEIKFIFQYRPV